MSLDGSYNPKQWESEITLKWRSQKVGSPEVQKQKQNLEDTAETFTVIMPPPNLTGGLHAGHAMNHYLQDTLARIHRQRGVQTLLYPGVDHAGLQLEGVINKLLEKEGRERKSLSDEEFLELCWQKVGEWRNNQSEQALQLGTTADYERELFTLDERASKMVMHAFNKYYEDGLIYKSSYIVNWSVGLQTALSDVSGEIEYAERIDPLVTFRYGTSVVESHAPELLKIVEKVKKALEKKPILVTTVRPETIFGDVAVAIHSKRLQELLRPTLKEHEIEQVVQALGTQQLSITQDLPEFNVKVRLLVSDKVDAEFGSGTLKVTPASDVFDYELYTQDFAAFGLPQFIHPIERSGKLSDQVTPEFRGLTREEARRKAIELLIHSGYITKSEEEKQVPKEYTSIPDVQLYEIDWNYSHNVSLCERTKTVIEPLVSEEFFLAYHRSTSRDGKTLAELGHLGVAQTNFYPVEFRKQADGFLDTIQDWCISRDLVWGHRIPVWYNIELNPTKQLFSKNTKTVVIAGTEHAVDDLVRITTTKPVAAGNWVQETKILDTWFSSSLWPLTTLGYYETNPKIAAIITDISGVFWDEHNNERSEVVAFLKQAKEAGISLYYLSNMDNKSMYDRFLATPSFSLFDGGVSAFESGHTKRSAIMYELLLGKYNIDPQKALYFDDVSEYVQMGRNAGIESIWYTPQTNLFEIFEQVAEGRISDFERYYPTQYMNTAKEIFYLWIVRMIVLGMYFTGTTPFQNVLITPTVLDGAGKKMSKSLGNGLQPEDAIERFSSDALRLGMLSGVLPNRNMRFGGDIADRIMEKMRNFGNKVWNIGRFLELQKEKALSDQEVSSASHWLMNRFADVQQKIEHVRRNYEFVPVIDAIMGFVWNDFADVYIEYLKTDPSQIRFAWQFFEELLVVLHPFMPFETEVIAHELYGTETLVWKTTSPIDLSNESRNLAEQFEKVIAVVETIRSQKGMFGIKPTQVIHGALVGDSYTNYFGFITAMTRLEIIEKNETMVKIVLPDCELYLDVIEYIPEVAKEIKKSELDLQKERKVLEGLQARLANHAFLEKAEPEAIEQTKRDVETLQQRLANLEAKITYLYIVQAAE